MRNQRLDKKKFLEMLKIRFTIEGACQSSGVPRPTIYRWLEQDKKFAAQLEQIRQECTHKVTDVAESVIIQQINNGSPVAARFWLLNMHPAFKKQRSIEIQKQKEVKKPAITFFTERRIRADGALLPSFEIDKDVDIDPEIRKRANKDFERIVEEMKNKTNPTSP